ncbi:SRPBCC family protein [Roseivirga sp. BDSF3-8]|uniref:SRPBCC family protein n=1 Tax=Roseivirga sp. BDSF3-8 TaxID=3241598 RepID=UPI0035326917
MRAYHTQIEIDAPHSAVWNRLVDFESYSVWNPLVFSLSGDIREGGIISTGITPLNRIYRARLLSFKKNQEIVWQGHRVAGFVLSGRHYYQLRRIGQERTLLTHGEYFSGLLSPFIPKGLLIKMQSAFEQHNYKLKEIVESEK